MSRLQQLQRLQRLPGALLANRRRTDTRPAWCTYLVCDRCNARCKMCDSWRLPRGRELTPAEVAVVFGRIGPLEVVRLTGGEPFLRRDLLDLAEAVLAASDPAVIHITTNGSLTDRVLDLAEAFSAPERLRFMVSLDGLEEEHDASRGAGVSFSRVLATLQGLVARRSRRGFGVSVNHTVISARSMADAPALRARLEALGIEVQSVLAYEDTAMYGEARRGARADDLIRGAMGYPLHPALQRADVEGFVQGELDRTSALADPLLRLGKRYYLRGLRDRLAARPSYQPPCTALRSHIRLLPDGTVPVCQFNTHTIGSLLETDLEALWHGAAATEERAWVDACTGCWAECEVMPSAIFSGDILRALR